MCQCLRVSWQQEPKWWTQKAVWILIQHSRRHSGSFHMQNTGLPMGRGGTLTITASHWVTIGDRTSDWLTNEKSWNGFHLKEKALTRIEGSSPVSFLEWEMGRDECAWQIELTIQYFDKDRLGHRRTIPGGTAAALKQEINEAWSQSVRDLWGICIQLFVFIYL